MKERTLSIIKPDGVAKGLIGEVIKRFEQGGFKIVAMKMVKMSKQEAEGFYAVHKERPFFDSVTSFMSSGPSVVMVLEGENVISKNRDLMGATDYREAAEGTIRREFATDIEKNIVHGSDAPETAAFEIGEYWNKDAQIDIVGLRDDGWTDLGECKWGSIRSPQTIVDELSAKRTKYPNPRNATIALRIFTRDPVKKPAGLPGVRWHDLGELYADER